MKKQHGSHLQSSPRPDLLRMVALWGRTRELSFELPTEEQVVAVACATALVAKCASGMPSHDVQSCGKQNTGLRGPKTRLMRHLGPV